MGSERFINEDELPKSITDEQYAAWFKLSWIPDGVGCRVGPPVDLDGNLLTPTPVAGLPTAEELAQEIRIIDGNHKLGAAAMAECLLSFLSRRLAALPREWDADTIKDAPEGLYFDAPMYTRQAAEDRLVNLSTEYKKFIGPITIPQPETRSQATATD